MRKLNILILVLAALILMSSCNASRVDCPTPELVKLHRMSAKRWKYYRHLMKEKSMARETAMAYESMRKIPRDGKKSEELEEWDCPQPGTTKHQRLIREKRRKLEKMHDKKKSEQSLDEIGQYSDDTESKP